MIELEPRLQACADLIKRDRVADIGTDHAYIPIYLIQQGIALRAVASDINKGPTARAMENVRAHALEERIEVMCVPGLESDRFLSCNGIIIAGMGAELIVSIIDAAPVCKQSGVRLVLQPMTKAEVLREHLWKNGYDITDDMAVREGNRIYQVIGAEYKGNVTSFTKAQALVGFSRPDDEVYRDLVKATVDKLSVRIKGKKSGGQDTVEEMALISELEKLI